MKKYQYYIYISGVGRDTLYRQTLDGKKMQFFRFGWTDAVNATFLLKSLTQDAASKILKQLGVKE